MREVFMVEQIHNPADKTLTQLITRNTSQIIWKGPCLLAGVGVTGDGAGGEIDIYDGVNDKAPHKIKIMCLTSTTFSMNAIHDPQFNYGIYMKVNAATTFGWVIFTPQEEHAKYPKRI